MNMPAKVCLGAGAFLVMSGGLLAITGFAMGAQTHLDLDWGRAHKSETPVDTGAPHVEEGTALPAFSRLDVDVSIGDVTVEYGGEYGIPSRYAAGRVTGSCLTGSTRSRR